MYELNDKIKNLEPYEPISGTYQIRLDANECPVNLPDEVRREFAARLQEIAFNRYPDPMAGRLVDSFAEYYNIKPTLVTAGNGSDELIFLVESAFMQKGDKMLVVSPDFSMYNFYSSICEVQSASFLKGDSLEIDVDALIRTINRDKIDLVIFSNPCNPTGKGITRAEAEKLVSSPSWSAPPRCVWALPWRIPPFPRRSRRSSRPITSTAFRRRSARSSTAKKKL